MADSVWRLEVEKIKKSIDLYGSLYLEVSLATEYESLVEILADNAGGRRKPISKIVH